MAKISLAGFKDPVRRPRYIIWALVAVLLVAGIMVPVLGVTSTRWFCSEACHKVQDDTILAYQASSHSNVSCMACHMPVGANPVVFLLHKAEALGELYMTVRDDFTLPLNAESEVALTMKPIQCTQCHNMKNRIVTPSPGIKIDHAVHAEVDAACPVCHNRVAHNENFDLTLKNPAKQGGEPNKKHVVFTSMTACFRCHGLEQTAAAPGTCSACHTPGFNLKPPSHSEPGFFPGGHAKLAKQYREEADKALAASASEGEGAKESSLGTAKAFAEGEPAGPVTKDQVPEIIEAARKSDHTTSIGEELPKVDTIYYCGTCHKDQFCKDCHGVDMPHPAAFIDPKNGSDPTGHPALSHTQGKKCEMCHGKDEKTQFCSSCHHGEKAGGWKFVKGEDWVSKQHPKAVEAGGVKACTDCHKTSFCSDCHNKNKVFPSSHKQSTWVKPGKPGAITVQGKSAAEPSAKHALEAQKSMETCAVCHGSGGTDAKFCKSCHKMQMPHPAEFKKQHVSGKNQQNLCKNCHQFREVCSNCHHAGSSLTKSWIDIHGSSVNKNGPSTCVEKCHTKNDCVKCHTKRNVKPSSHKASDFVHDYSSNKAFHVRLYEKDGEICTYCHSGSADSLAKSKFCSNCHKLEMPHPIKSGEKQKFMHKDGFEKHQLSKSTCANCHKPNFCNSCHHEGAPSNKPWVRYHPNVVKKNGADPCFDCHKETFCSNCHVNLAKRGLK